MLYHATFIVQKTVVFETMYHYIFFSYLRRIACHLKTYLVIMVLLLDIIDEFWDNQRDMVLPEQKKRLLKAKIAVALHDELGRVPKEEEINTIFLTARVMYKAVLGLHFQRQEQKKQGQLAIF